MTIRKLSIVLLSLMFSLVAMIAIAEENNIPTIDTAIPLSPNDTKDKYSLKITGKNFGQKQNGSLVQLTFIKDGQKVETVPITADHNKWSDKEILVETPPVSSDTVFVELNIQTGGGADKHTTTIVKEVRNYQFTFVPKAEKILSPRYLRGHAPLSSYLPTYIGETPVHSASTNEGELKIQFSVKFEIIEETDWYFGYTQKSFWSIQKESEPFRETNYSPETFWLYKPDKLSWLPVVQAGIFRHESTGEAGVGSHGWNITYVEPAFYWKGLYILPRLWVPSVAQGFREKEAAPDNPDIFKYYGYGKLSAIYERKEAQYSLSLQHAPRDNSITWEGQVDFSVGAIVKNLKLNPNLFIQARNGYGEGLKTYNVKTSSVVIGVSVVR
jgi:outer membrane phospholipase A